MPLAEASGAEAEAQHDRLFFALWPAEDVRERLAAAARSAQALRGGRAMRAETLHLTLAFIGAFPRGRLAELLALAAGIEVEGFGFCLDRLGAWERKRLLWAGCSAPVEALGRLADRLAARLVDAGVVGGKPAFTPHVTLVRKARPEGGLPCLEPIVWAVRDFVLVRSVLSAKGADYEVVGRWPSAQPGAEDRA